MKAFALILILSISQIVSAEILHSNYEARHQELIEKAIAKECYLRIAKATQTENTVVTRKIDNGITDRTYTTSILVLAGVDEYHSEDWSVVITTQYADMYDHENKNWGVYSVESVKCY